MENKKRIFKEFGIYAIILLAVILVKVYVFSFVVVHGVSMMDNLHDKDIMFLDKISVNFNNIKRFDIVVVDTKDEQIIKRVIGLPGEKVEYKDNKLYVNNKLVKDDHTEKITSNFNVTLDKNEYYVLGDNRTNSLDSRVLGPIKKSKIRGIARVILFPFHRISVK